MMWDGTPWDGKVWDGRTKERSQVIDHIKQDYKTLTRFGMEDFKRDPEIILIACKVDYRALQYAHDSLKGDPHFLVSLVGVVPASVVLIYANDSVKADRQFILSIVKLDGTALKVGGGLANGHWFMKDREIALAAVEQNADALEWVFEFDTDREIVLAAVKQKGETLEFAHPILSKDREIALSAVKQNGMALEHVDFQVIGRPREHPEDDLKRDYVIVLAAVKNKSEALTFADPVLFDNDLFLREAVDVAWDARKFFPEDKKHDPKFLRPGPDQTRILLAAATHLPPELCEYIGCWYCCRSKCLN